MGVLTLNILSRSEIDQLKALLNEVVQALPKQQRNSEIQASIAERLLKLAAAGERDPIKLKGNALLVLQQDSSQLSGEQHGN